MIAVQEQYKKIRVRQGGVGSRGPSPSGRVGTPGLRDMAPQRAASHEPSPRRNLPRPRV